MGRNQVLEWTTVEADAYTMSMDSAFWVWNLVANIAYGERYADVMPLVQRKIHFYQDQCLFSDNKDSCRADQFFKTTAKIDAEAEALLLNNSTASEAIELITEFGVNTGEKMTKDWRDFWMYLFVRFRDGFTITDPVKTQCIGKQRRDCTSRRIPTTSETGYSGEWYARLIADGDNAAHYHVPADQLQSSAVRAANRRKILRMDKVPDHGLGRKSKGEILV